MSVLFAAACECLAWSLVLFLFITIIVRVISVDPGIIASLASRDEIWEIVIRAKVGSFSRSFSRS